MKKQIVSMKRGAQKGFTLIELMIVVAIIGILAAFAIPMFQDYTVRTRIGEGLVLASTYKNHVVDNAINGIMTGAANDYNVGSPAFQATTNTNTIAITPATGIITITGTAKANTIILRLTPTAPYMNADNTALEAEGPLRAVGIPAGRIAWACTSVATAQKSQIPSECRADNAP